MNRKVSSLFTDEDIVAFENVILNMQLIPTVP